MPIFNLNFSFQIVALIRKKSLLEQSFFYECRRHAKRHPPIKGETVLLKRGEKTCACDAAGRSIRRPSTRQTLLTCLLGTFSNKSLQEIFNYFRYMIKNDNLSLIDLKITLAKIKVISASCNHIKDIMVNLLKL